MKIKIPSLTELSATSVIFTDQPIPKKVIPILSTIASRKMVELENWAISTQSWRGHVVRKILPLIPGSDAEQKFLFIIHYAREQLRNNPRRSEILERAKQMRMIRGISYVMSEAIGETAFTEAIDFHRKLRNVCNQLRFLPSAQNLTKHSEKIFDHAGWVHMIENLKSDVEAGVLLLTAIESSHQEIFESIYVEHSAEFETYMKRAIYIAADQGRYGFFDELFSDKYTELCSSKMFERLICPPGDVRLSRRALEKFPAQFFSRDQIHRALTETIKHLERDHVHTILPVLLQRHGQNVPNDLLEGALEAIFNLMQNEKENANVTAGLESLLKHDEANNYLISANHIKKLILKALETKRKGSIKTFIHMLLRYRGQSIPDSLRAKASKTSCVIL